MKLDASPLLAKARSRKSTPRKLAASAAVVPAVGKSSTSKLKSTKPKPAKQEHANAALKAPKAAKPARSRGHAARSNQLSHLPKRIMLDSPVVIMALEHDNPRRQSDAKVQDARELWERALAECTVLLPPFVVLDLLLGGVQAPLPALRNLMHVAFTYEVAESMSSWASASAASKPAARKAKSRTPAAVAPSARVGLRYEALIVGTAKFYGAEVLVTHDAATAELATAAGLRVADPSVLLRWTQRGLPGIEA